MKIAIALCSLLCFATVGALAQSKSAPAVAAPHATLPPGITVSEAYPLPTADHAAFRDYQHEDEKLEIANQKMLVEIEKNKARQVQLEDAMKLIALRFANAQHIDLEVNELDADAVKLVKRKGKP